MSNRLSSGIGGKLEVRLRILRSRFHDGGRGNMWQVHMWMAVPFGFIQDLLYKIPFVKKVKSFKGDRILRFLKYVILAVFVILLPMFVVDIIGQGDPTFCKYICPAERLRGEYL